MKRIVLLCVAFFTISTIGLSNDNRIYDIIKRNDTLLVVCDPEVMNPISIR